MQTIDPKGTLLHRYPFLMIDGITEINTEKSIKGYKLITNNDWFITETQKTMPHILIVEALAQLGKFAEPKNSEGIGFLSSFDGVSFLGDAFPGNRLDLHYEVLRNKKGISLGKGIASINGRTIVKVEKILVLTRVR
ncbi:hypothetical protein BAMA_00550 [Bacillus manliponensis]|uniref:Beta-hydroxyacyl-ACP dehydratase n=1 Tax=Bacillus manliponensis TaxID=574376 RepID=A0A073K471_9BACI|nr:hypothetical protein BAMA_00550 [Bacillus manliponensis]